MRRVLAFAALLPAILIFASAVARADPPAASAPDPPLHWNEEYTRFRPVEYPVTGVLGGAAIAMFLWVPATTQPHWTGGILIDEPVRDAVRMRSLSGLQAVWTVSDVVDISLTVLTVGIDSFAVPLLRGSPDVAVQLTLMDGEAFALSSIVTFSMYDSIGRARPLYADCQSNPHGPGCSGSLTASFPSGHTNEAFTGAGVSCAHHLHVPIYGSRFWDTLACVRDLFLATSDGVLRMMGDRHYLSDMLTGAAIGFGFGYGTPWLLHYRPSSDAPTVSWSVSPMMGQQMGLLLVGGF
jgi:membrane-associated phospholipid phosphatase